MQAIVFAAGQATPDGLATLAPIIEAAELVVAADGGAVLAAQAGTGVDAVLGDLDSAPAELVDELRRGGTEVVEVSPDKDETDLELALAYVAAAGADQVTVVGALGGRVDHELANVGLIAARRWHDAGIAMTIDDGVCRIVVVHDSVLLAEPPGTTISVIPSAGHARGVNERGMQWDLHDATLLAGSPQGMSNVAVAETQKISVEEGCLLVIIDRTE
ncbi:MAG: thiamine diphosphokinase [Actinomycetota bacterium]